MKLHISNISIALILFSIVASSCGSPKEPETIYVEVTAIPSNQDLQGEQEVPEVEEEPDGILFFACFNRSDDYSKLSSLAFSNNINLKIIPCRGDTDYRKFEKAIFNHSVVVYGGHSESEVLLSITEFVENGGKAMILYDAGDWGKGVDDNWVQIHQELFGVSGVYEGISFYNNDDSLLLPKDMMPSFLKDFTIGFAEEGGDHRITGYIVAAEGGIEEGWISDEETGKTRLVTYLNNENNLFFFPRGTVYNSSLNNDIPRIDFFDDQNIDYFDNEEAALRLLQFLSNW